MANELSVSYTGSNAVYAIIRRTADSTVWNPGASAFVSWNDANIADYDIPMTDREGSLYSATFPSSITTMVEYRIFYYARAVATPSITDILLGSEEGLWTGTDISPHTITSGGGAGGTYCTTSDVKSILPHEMIDRMDDPIPDIDAEITTNDILGYIQRADMVINGMLEQYYVVPLRRIKHVHAGIVNSTTATVYGYPHPISFCSQRLAAAYIYNERYTGDAGHTDGSVYGERYEKQAMDELNKIQEGLIMLPGQVYKGYRYKRAESLNTARFPAADKRT